MEAAKFPWWVGIPASIGVTIVGIVAPTFLPVWVQAVLFGIGVLAVAWSILAGVWHYRASWGKRMASAVLLLAIGLLIVACGCVLTWWGTSAIAALSKKSEATADGKAESTIPAALASKEITPVASQLSTEPASGTVPPKRFETLPAKPVHPQDQPRVAPHTAPVAQLDDVAAERGRRGDILRQITSLYIFSHDNISSRMMAGMELPPADFINAELEKQGEHWRVRAVKGSNAEIFDSN